MERTAKIFVDGFYIDCISFEDPASDNTDFAALALTSQVKSHLGNKKVVSVTPVPRLLPKIILIATEL